MMELYNKEDGYFEMRSLVLTYILVNDVSVVAHDIPTDGVIIEFTTHEALSQVLTVCFPDFPQYEDDTFTQIIFDRFSYKVIVK